MSVGAQHADEAAPAVVKQPTAREASPIAAARGWPGTWVTARQFGSPDPIPRTALRLRFCSADVGPEVGSRSTERAP